MKIGLVSLGALAVHVSVPGGGWGGAETGMAVLGESLRKRGHDVSVVLSNYAGPALKAPRLTSLPLVNAYTTADGVPGLRFLRRWVEFQAALDRVGADVYLQMCAGRATGQTALFCRRRRRAFVFATASDSDVDPRRVRLAACDRGIYAWGLRRADRVVTQHATQAEALRRHYGVDSTPIAMASPIPPRKGTPGSPPVVVWLGTLRSVKRPERVLALARRLPGVRFRMLGGPSAGEPALYREVEREAASLANVEFLGTVPDVAPHLDEAWLLLNTSTTEGFPTTFLEAWARGVPVVSHFDPAGLVSRCGLGLIAPEGEAPLAEAVSRVIADRALRDRLGDAARAYVEREHDPDVVAARFESEFEAALRARG